MSNPRGGVFDVDLGHTDPQLVIPYGGMVRVDGPARRITVWVNGAGNLGSPWRELGNRCRSAAPVGRHTFGLA